MNPARILAQATARLHRQGLLNSSPVTLRWTDTTRPPGYLPDLESTHAGSVVAERSEEVSAFVHYVNIHHTGYSHFAQVKLGDVILDFPGDVALDGRASLRFEIGGKIYVQKDGGDELAASWDVRCGGVPVTRTVLVTLLS